MAAFSARFFTVLREANSVGVGVDLDLTNLTTPGRLLMAFGNSGANAPGDIITLGTPGWTTIAAGNMRVLDDGVAGAWLRVADGTEGVVSIAGPAQTYGVVIEVTGAMPGKAGFGGVVDTPAGAVNTGASNYMTYAGHLVGSRVNTRVLFVHGADAPASTPLLYEDYLFRMGVGETWTPGAGTPIPPAQPGPVSVVSESANTSRMGGTTVHTVDIPTTQTGSSVPEVHFTTTYPGSIGGPISGVIEFDLELPRGGWQVNAMAMG